MGKVSCYLATIHVISPWIIFWARKLIAVWCTAEKIRYLKLKIVFCVTAITFVGNFMIYHAGIWHLTFFAGNCQSVFFTQEDSIIVTCWLTIWDMCNAQKSLVPRLLSMHVIQSISGYFRFHYVATLGAQFACTGVGYCISAIFNPKNSQMASVTYALICSLVSGKKRWGIQ